MRAFLGIDLNRYEKRLSKIKVLKKDDDLRKVGSYHLTLFFWRNLSKKRARIIAEKLESFKYEKFKLKADKIVVFPSVLKPRVFSLGFSNDEKLFVLRDRVLKHTEIKGKYEFVPHLTLFRRRGFGFKPDGERIEIEHFEPIEIMVNNVGLYESKIVDGKRKHVVLSRLNLSCLINSCGCQQRVHNFL